MMIRFIAGMLIGASVIAFADDIQFTKGPALVYMPAGVTPNGNVHAIPMDEKGFVICSPEHPH